jgi:hypothetical protein
VERHWLTVFLRRSVGALLTVSWADQFEMIDGMPKSNSLLPFHLVRQWGQFCFSIRRSPVYSINDKDEAINAPSHGVATIDIFLDGLMVY